MSKGTKELIINGDSMTVTINVPEQLNAGSAISLAKRLTMLAKLVGKSSRGSLAVNDEEEIEEKPKRTYSKRKIWSKNIMESYLKDYQRYDADFVAKKYDLNRSQVWSKADYCRMRLGLKNKSKSNNK